MRYALLVVALALVGCVSPAMSRMDDGAKLEAAQEWEQADRVYGRIMTDMISEGEWEDVREARCRVRGEIAREQAAALNPPESTFAEIEAIRDFLDGCPVVEDVETELANAGIARAMKLYDEKVVKLLEAGELFEAGRASRQILRYLPDDHPYYRRLAEARERELARLRSARDTHDGYPDTQAVFDLVMSAWNRESVSTPKSARAGELTVSRPEPAPISVGDTCAGLASVGIPPASGDTVEGGTTFTASAVLENCFDRRSVAQVLEPYFETIEVIEEVPKVVSTKTKKTTTTVTERRSCYTSKNGFGSGCVTIGKDTDRSSYYEVNHQVVKVKEKVRKIVPAERPALRATETIVATLKVTVTIDGKTATVSVPVEGTLEGPFVSPEMAPESVPGPNRGALQNVLKRRAVDATYRAARGLATNMRRSTKAEEWTAAMESGDEKSAREAATTMWLLGQYRSEDNDLDDIFGFDLFASDKVPAIGRPSLGLGSIFYSRSFSPRDRNIPHASVFRRGYPIQSLGVLGHIIDPDPDNELIAQPDRTSYGLKAKLALRADAFDTLYADDGLSAIFGYDLGVGLGYRTGEDYAAPRPARETSIGDEGRLVVGFELGFPVMVGWRSPNFQLAAGLRADWRNFAVGHSWSQGGAVLTTTRMMFRFHPMFPWIFEGWGLNVLGGNHDFRGLQLDVPIFYKGWIRLRAEQLFIKTRVYGLNENDPVVIDDALVEDLRIGFVYGF